MLFSIVTPSYRGSDWLKLCVASVADQQVALEHIVQDAGSDDGTLDWLLKDSRVKAYVERDTGMYDAINRGLTRAKGEVLAWLNCDEQYLPGALTTVREFFQRNPDSDVCFGDIVMVDPQGNYLFHRKVQTPLKYHTWTCHLSTLSCGMFFRSRLYFAKGHKFDPGFRDAGDGEWMVRLLRDRIRMGTLKRFTSVFTCTGANMSAGPNARRENRTLYRTAPIWARQLSPVFVIQHRLRRLFGGMYRQEPFAFELYTQDSPRRRIVRPAPQPRTRPPGRLYTRAADI